MRANLILATRGVSHAEVSVTAVREYGAGFVGFVVPLCFYHGCETPVYQHVEGFADGVEGDEVGGGEVSGDFEG